MATRPTSKKHTYLAYDVCRVRTKSTRINTRANQTRISPDDEIQCQQIYERLEQLQPNGVCTNIETLRRALFPPVPISKNKHEQILLLKTSYQRLKKLPEIQIHDPPKSREFTPTSLLTFDQIINQVQKHAAINYSYYTRTK